MGLWKNNILTWGKARLKVSKINKYICQMSDFTAICPEMSCYETMCWYLASGGEKISRCCIKPVSQFTLTGIWRLSITLQVWWFLLDPLVWDPKWNLHCFFWDFSCLCGRHGATNPLLSHAYVPAHALQLQGEVAWQEFLCGWADFWCLCHASVSYDQHCAAGHAGKPPSVHCFPAALQWCIWIDVDVLC